MIQIPEYVKFVYRHNGIPEEEWPEHFAVDGKSCHGRSNGLSKTVANIYKMLYRDIRRGL